MNEKDALSAIYSTINKYRSKVGKSVFLKIVYRLKGLDARACFMSDTSEYWMIRDSYDIVYGNGLPHDINTSKEYPILNKLYLNLQKDILKTEGMSEYLENIREIRLKKQLVEKLKR